ncbi:hypothetical protein F511_44290 [Dorcoceras hygrometricum]|uniref:Uncharacterized protein n=1 Tax=Dorcoceras hygrometricum TaxID=472368 RepID=A0A2Z7BDU5_9LAMI|nr:hypothetical protein F511_44290 [Dorcoceras hygrometricum]
MGMNRMFICWTRTRCAGSKSITKSIYLDLSFIVTTTTTQLTLTLSNSLRPLSSNLTPPPPPPVHAAAAASPEFVPAKFDEENPSASISSSLLVQADEGVSHPVVDLIDDIYAAYREEPAFL